MKTDVKKRCFKFTNLTIADNHGNMQMMNGITKVQKWIISLLIHDSGVIIQSLVCGEVNGNGNYRETEQVSAQICAFGSNYVGFVTVCSEMTRIIAKTSVENTAIPSLILHELIVSEKSKWYKPLGVIKNEKNVWEGGILIENLICGSITSVRAVLIQKRRAQIYKLRCPSWVWGRNGKGLDFCDPTMTKLEGKHGLSVRVRTGFA